MVFVESEFVLNNCVMTSTCVARLLTCDHKNDDTVPPAARATAGTLQGASRCATCTAGQPNDPLRPGD